MLLLQPHVFCQTTTVTGPAPNIWRIWYAFSAVRQEITQSKIAEAGTTLSRYFVDKFLEMSLKSGLFHQRRKDTRVLCIVLFFVLPLLLLVKNRVQFLSLSDPLCLQTQFHKTTLTTVHKIQIKPTPVWCQLSCSMIYRHIVFVHVCSCNLHCRLDGCGI